jgi:isopentenyldiphosphate isomerase
VTAAEELFDICDENGRPLGHAKRRSLVHRDGDWHRSFHCWLVDTDRVGEPWILLQRRALDKATWPGRWDVSVAGHYAAGEGIEGGLREIQEEIGLDVDADRLILAGRRREQVFFASGLIEREVQDVYFLPGRIDLGALRPNTEVIALGRVPARTLGRLAEGSLLHTTIRGGIVDDGRVEPLNIEVATDDLVPRGGYYASVVSFAQRLGRGERLPRALGWLP